MISQLENHLWHSTVFTCAVALLTLMLRRNRAALRHGLWMTASIKFLVPFSLLIGIGREVPWPNVPAIAEPRLAIVEQVSEPFALQTSPPATHSAPKPTSPVPAVLFGVWLCGFTAHSLVWFRRWRRIRVALRAASPAFLNLPARAMFGPTHLEPGVFGILKPVLLLPRGITERLTPAQFDAIIAHELCHVQRRDNLAAAIHMVVEALFWFHPLVWWIERRLVEERERACDEKVLQMAIDPQVYAEGIVSVCRLYLEAPLVCISGVTGANLRKRIEDIMTNRMTVRLSLAQQAVLAAGAIAALGLPVLAGIMSPAGIRAQSPLPQSPAAQLGPGRFPKFEVVSIKPCKPGVTNGGGPPGAGSSPGRLRTTCGILADTDNTGMIQVAYNRYAGGYLSSFRMIPIEGAPDWMHSERFDIDATSDGQPSILMMQGPMMQGVLENRFRLKIHRETRQGPVYELALGKGSPKLKPLAEGSCIPAAIGHPLPELTADQRRCTDIVNPRGSVEFEGGTLSMFAGLLGLALDRPVIDKTGIMGQFAIHLVFSPDDSATPGPAPDDRGAPTAARTPDAPGIFQAIQEQVGLKLVPARGPVDVLVIDHIERPSEN
jgi:uncharacterized protein (TIGR03435 family)